MNEQNKGIKRKSISPIKTNTGPTYKKIELKPSKSPIKYSKESQK